MKQRRPVILTAVPIAFPYLIRVRVQVLDEDRKSVLQVREWTPLLPWQRIEILPFQPGVREQSELLLRDGMEADLGLHLLDIDLDDAVSFELA